MPEIGSFIVRILGHVSADGVTDFTVLLMLFLFALALLSARKGKHPGFIHYTPNLLTSLGILGTFAGIIIGLLDFNVKDIDGSIGPLLEGLKTAFITSLAGMTLAIIFKLIESSGTMLPAVTLDQPEYVGPEEIYAELKSQLKALEQIVRAIAGDEDSALVSQIRLLRSDAKDQAAVAMEQLKSQNDHQSTIGRIVEQQSTRQQEFAQELWKKLDQFAEMMSKSATEQVITALKEVITDFNRNLTEQFGENFKQLNSAVEKLVQWQDNYKVQLQQMHDQYAQGVQAIETTGQAVATISEHTQQIPVTMGELKALLETTQHQLNELTRHLEAFRDMRDKAVEAVPQIQQQMRNMVEDVSGAVKGAGEHIMTASQAVNVAIVQGAEDFKNNVNRTNEGLVTASDQLANNSEKIREQLEDTVTEINEHVRNMIASLIDGSKGIGNTLIESNKNLQQETKEITYQVTDSIESMQKRLESALEEIFKAQTREMSRTFSALEEEVRKSVGTTGEAVNKQLEAMDTAMQREMERVMNEMGRALAAISGQFTNDYSKLVDAMGRVIRQGESIHRTVN